MNDHQRCLPALPGRRRLLDTAVLLFVLSSVGVGYASATRAGTLMRGSPGMDLAWSPDSAAFAVARGNGDVEVWRPTPHAHATSRRFRGGPEAARTVAYTADGDWLVSTDIFEKVWFWPLRADGARARLAARGAPESVGGSLAIAAHPSAPLVAVARGLGTVEIWRTDGTLRAVLGPFRGAVRSLAFLPGGWLAVGAAPFGHPDAPTAVTLWNDASWTLAASFPLPGWDDFAGLAASPDGTQLFLYARLDGEPYASEGLLDLLSGSFVPLTIDPARTVESAAYDPQGDLLVVALGAVSRESGMEFYDSETYTRARPSIAMDVHGPLVVRISPDGRFVAVATHGSALVLPL